MRVSVNSAFSNSQMTSPGCDDASDGERPRQAAISWSRRICKSRCPATVCTDWPSSSGPPTSCETGEQWLLGTLARRRPSYLQEEEEGGGVISRCAISHSCNSYTSGVGSIAPSTELSLHCTCCLWSIYVRRTHFTHLSRKTCVQLDSARTPAAGSRTTCSTEANEATSSPVLMKVIKKHAHPV